MNPKLKPTPMKYKYDLMHNNTPSYASSVVTWDCAKMGKITFNRVVRWLETGIAKYSYGEAANMYREIRDRFGLPDFVVRGCTGNPSNRGSQGMISWKKATPQLMEAITKVWETERVIHRMENGDKEHYYTPWYLNYSKLEADSGQIWLDNVHDLTEIERCVAEIVSSEEIKAKREQAVEFVKSGGKLEFTWR